ncbi:MAG: ComEA family DNA-binding protein [Syntrophomonadaceae bacterium]|nr:ComEA family DNA-binding protein [Syntrophomonadaceae bacterium]
MLLDIDKRFLAAAVIAVLISFGLGYQYGLWTENKQAVQTSLANPEQAAPLEQDQDASKRVFVYVVGEVSNPGVVEMQEGDRVFQAIEQARPTEQADLAAVNMAAPLVDGEMIVVPKIGEVQSERELGQAGIGPDGSGKGMVNINKATAEEMDRLLPGIGPEMARRIVEYREKNRGFSSIEEIKEVSGIGEKRFEDMKDLICIR